MGLRSFVERETLKNVGAKRFGVEDGGSEKDVVFDSIFSKGKGRSGGSDELTFGEDCE